MEMMTLREMYDKYLEFRKANGKVITPGSFQPIKSLIYFIENKNKTPYLTQELYQKWKDDKKRSYSALSVVACFLRYLREKDYLNLIFSAPKYPRHPRTPVFDMPLKASVVSDMMQKFFDWRNQTVPLNSSYHYQLIRFNNFCKDCLPQNNLLTNEMIEKWCETREYESSVTRNCRVIPISQFVEFAIAHGWKGIDVPKRLPISQRRGQTSHIFTKDELSYFFYHCDRQKQGKNENDNDYKIRTIVISVVFRLLYSTGMLPYQALSLKRQDIDFDNGIITYYVASSKSYNRIAVVKSTLNMLRKYDSAMEKLMPGRTPFFPNRHGEHLSSCCLEKRFQKIWYLVSSERAKPLDFRVTYAVENINSWDNDTMDENIELLCLSRSMGHKNINVTANFLSLVPRFRKDLIEKSSENLRNLVPKQNIDENEKENEQ